MLSACHLTFIAWRHKKRGRIGRMAKVATKVKLSKMVHSGTLAFNAVTTSFPFE
jgi:hypothetical protein